MIRQWISKSGAVLGIAPFLFAASVCAQTLEDAAFVLLGEVHDNPAHHARQADILRDIRPKAVVFEMLTPAEAAALAEVTRSEAAMRNAVAGFHWSNIAEYAEILAASPVILGAALPRGEVRDAFHKGAAAVFGDGADQYLLTQELPEAELAERKQAQFDAHCEAMPLDMMGGMVEAQRLRDAHFARAMIAAGNTYGYPIVLIAGNGHVRRDWGVPVYLTAKAPHLEIFALGQSEDGRNWGDFDDVRDAPSPERGDPCAAFK